MEIVIELSDETYKDIKEENGIYGINNGLSARITGKVVGAIQNGTPHETITEFADRCRECGREKVLNKIRTEIEQIELLARYTRGDIKQMALDIIDKYRNE